MVLASSIVKILRFYSESIYFLNGYAVEKSGMLMYAQIMIFKQKHPENSQQILFFIYPTGKRKRKGKTWVDEKYYNAKILALCWLSIVWIRNMSVSMVTTPLVSSFQTQHPKLAQCTLFFFHHFHIFFSSSSFPSGQLIFIAFLKSFFFFMRNEFASQNLKKALEILFYNWLLDMGFCKYNCHTQRESFNVLICVFIEALISFFYLAINRLKKIKFIFNVF